MIALAAPSADFEVGASMVGLVLVAAGWALVWFGRSLIAERRAERRHQLELAESAAKRSALRTTPAYQEAWEQHVADAIRATEDATVHQFPPRNVVPFQRKAGESS